MAPRPQLWIVAVQYKDEPKGEWGNWSLHCGTEGEMARVFAKLSRAPVIAALFLARVHDVRGYGDRRVLNG